MNLRWVMRWFLINLSLNIAALKEVSPREDGSSSTDRDAVVVGDTVRDRTVHTNWSSGNNHISPLTKKKTTRIKLSWLVMQ